MRVGFNPLQCQHRVATRLPQHVFFHVISWTQTLMKGFELLTFTVRHICVVLFRQNTKCCINTQSP